MKVFCEVLGGGEWGGKTSFKLNIVLCCLFCYPFQFHSALLS